MPETALSDRPRGPAGQPAALWVGVAILALLLGWALRASAVVTVPIVSAILIAVVLAPLDRAIRCRLPRPLAWVGRVAVVGVLLLALAVFFAGLIYSARQVIEEMPRITGALEDLLPPGLQEMSVDRFVYGGGDAEATPPTAAPSNGAGETADATPSPPRETGQPEAGGAPAGEGAGSATADPSAGASDAEARAENGAGGGATAFSDPMLPQSLRDLVNQAGSTAATWAVEASTSLARRIAGAVGTFVGATIIVVFLVLLALSEGPTWRRKLGGLWPAGDDSWQHALDTMSRKLRSFLLVRAAMGLLSALLYVGWLSLFGLDLLLVWGVITFLLGFVPNLGSVVSGVLPALYALVTRDLQTAALVSVGLFAIEQIIGNFLDPRLQGRQIAVSPVVVLVAILLWGWIWGVAGALLAVPVTVSLLVAFAHVPALRPVALLLSNQTTTDELMASMRR
ncbi:AI-2E family transporter [Rhodovulum sp. 12E13]|uniref:AI-2E family transporter n=1 Tax=Rhodovulum sp. 12E13 TaxID=2203891 RepID=UPI000E167DA1|nr:AI-2E family transporter [Rhodovulum sp. 12E13]RDC69935.1 AI-2E family transporter [Rhodovulum sp. 12E13]